MTGPKQLLALTWLALAGIYNPWTFDWLLGDASLYTDLMELAVLALGVSCVLWGGWTLKSPLSPAKQKLHVFLLMTFVAVPLAGEAMFRSAIHLGSYRFRNASLYADGFSDDDYWKLNERWRNRSTPAHDPTLGWRTHRTPENPLGILRKEGYTPQLENTVLCFGDSFTAGNVPLGQRIPDFIDQGLDGMLAYNYGVGGYGVGQMYLSYLEHQPEFVDPVIVVSIFVRDLDRSLLSVRDGPKPFFRLEDGKLNLHGVPIPEQREAWDAAHPLKLRSYFLAWIAKGLWRLTLDDLPRNSTHRQQKKRDLNRAILEALTKDARSKKLRLLFVTYPPSDFLEFEGWRSPFLGEVFADLNVPWLDGEAVLRADMQASGRGSDSYFQEDNHPNPLTNRIFAVATLKQLRSLWDVPTHLSD